MQSDVMAGRFSQGQVLLEGQRLAKAGKELM